MPMHQSRWSRGLEPNNDVHIYLGDDPRIFFELPPTVVSLKQLLCAVLGHKGTEPVTMANGGVVTFEEV